MEINVKVTIHEDFRVACEIFDIPAQKILQLIIDHISLPRFYGNPSGKEKWSTLLLLHYIDNVLPDDELEMDLHEPFMSEISKAVPDMLDDAPEQSEEIEEAVREICKRWHLEVLKHRAEYLLNDLPFSPPSTRTHL